MLQKSILPVGMLLILTAAALGLAIGPGAQAAQDPTPTLAPIPDPVLGEFDPDSVAGIDLAAYPIVPEISAQAVTLYREGIAAGNNPHAFIKVGDCMTHHPKFLIPIGEADYDLGDYADLQPVIDQFMDGDLNSFSRESQAAAGGFNTASILDSLWANPNACEAGESPLTCEFRIAQPSIALVMFGTNDVQYLNESQFDYFLRAIIAETMRNGTLPVVSTFPFRPEFPEKSVLYNQIVVQAALDYDVPLINLWLALEPLPNQGIDAVETTHMSEPADGAACYFIGPNLEAGFTVRNLVTLQALDAVLQAVAED
ncbi:MAG: SGNH/GDSL hydrolase family protein [Anaerolineae bacterium]|nr:SGNH/GDSL hydrolase family protein [Anaerolineae bacterium]